MSTETFLVLPTPESYGTPSRRQGSDMTAHVDMTTEERALVEVARSRLAQFSTSRGMHVCALALLAEAALHEALAAGIDVDRLAAELEISPHALDSILHGNPRLLELHPLHAR